MAAPKRRGSFLNPYYDTSGNWVIGQYTNIINVDNENFFIDPKPLFPKEKPVLTEQEQIDAEVREAISKPRREAEIARRVAAVQALELLLDAEDGAVLRFKRVYATKTYSYAAIKIEERWYLTGTMAKAGGYTHEHLVEWMTTGAGLVSDVQVANGWDAVL